MIFLEYFSDTVVSPLYIPSWPPGEHLLSGVGCGAGKCKIRPTADERLTIISIHNSTEICQIFPDLNMLLYGKLAPYLDNILREVKMPHIWTFKRLYGALRPLVNLF